MLLNSSLPITVDAPSIRHARPRALARRVYLGVFCLFILCMGISSPASAADMLQVVDTQKRVTMDGMATITEYANAFSTIGGDGALIELGPDILLGTSEGEFFLIKNDLSVQSANIPPLDVGATAYQKQTRYNYTEKPPRLHGMTLYKGRLFVAVDRFDAKDNAIYFAVFSIELGKKEWRRVYQSPALDTPYYSMGGGGRMTTIGDAIYFSVGDYSFDRQNNLPSDFAAQNPKLPFGKVMKLDPVTGKTKPYASGLRNALGLANDNGKLIITDNGPRGGDSVYITRAGANYGWPYASLGRRYFDFGPYTKPSSVKDKKVKKQNREDTKFPYQQPDFTFVPSVAPTQIIKLDHTMKDWDGDFLVANLKGRGISRLHREKGRFAYAEPIFIGARIRDIVQHNGKIWMLTDAGGIMTLTLDAPEEVFPDVSKAIQKCMICHVINPDSHAQAPFAPNLYEVVGRKAGTSAFTGYSSAMKKAAASITWDHNTLFAFLRAPQSLIPGTAMPNLAYSSSDSEIEGIIAALTALAPPKPQPAAPPASGEKAPAAKP